MNSDDPGYEARKMENAMKRMLKKERLDMTQVFLAAPGGVTNVTGGLSSLNVSVIKAAVDAMIASASVEDDIEPTMLFMSGTSSYLTPKSRKNNMRGSSLFVITAFLLLQLMQTTYGNMLAFRNLCMVRGPIEGTDKKGHALVVEKLGVVGDGIHGILDLRIRESTSRPSISGSIRSRTNMSHFSCITISKPLSPS